MNPLLLMLLPLFLVGCAVGASDDEFRVDWEAWQQTRYADLQAPDGYLSLAGLYWLEDGEHAFGSDASNALVFPDKAPARIGTFMVDDSTVTMRIEPGADVMHDGAAVTEMVMQDDHDGKPTVVYLDSLNWYVIRRSRGLAIRLLDTESAVRIGFDGIDTFPLDPAWRLEARFEPYDPPREINMPSITGVDERETVPGAVVFDLNGETYRLDVTGVPGDDRYFVVFGDATNGTETYGGGRFVWIDAEDENGRIVIDFNRAYNPPCVFSPYATCPLPPPQNRLPFGIEAGERNYSAAH
ncbi:MAG: DUF1684 domain-containing protein [Rhodothermaceae bacterium]|nr:DUF1684 domain-containing protein [Rhodothermaceae bacterium]